MPSAPSPNRSRLLFALLYLGEGAPIGFIWWALPTWLRLQGLPVDQITTLTSLLVLPWVGKFVWAPLIDRIRDTRRGLRGCIVAAQLTMGATLLPLIWLNVADAFEIVGGLLLLHALAAATQDVAVDALALRIVPPNDRGRLNGGMQAGMLLGRSAFGGGALVLSAYLGWPVVIWTLIACIWLSTTSVLLLPRVDAVQAVEQPRVRGADLIRIVNRSSLWLGLIFAGTAGAAFEAAGILSGPMLVERGWAEDEIGWLRAVPVVVATIIGGLLGGYYADRLGRARMVITGIMGFATMVIALSVLNARQEVAEWLFSVVLTALYLFIGVFTASSYALFMGLSRPPLAATQFSAFMSATNGCEAWASWSGGLIVSRFNYGTAFVVMSAVSLLTLPLVKWLDRRASDPQE